MAYSTALRYGGAALVGGVGGSYLGIDPLVSAGVTTGAYAAFRHRGAIKRVGAPVAAGIGKRIPPGVKQAFRTGGRLLGKAFVGLEAVMLASDIKEGRGITSDVYEAYNRNDPIGAATGIAGGVGMHALTYQWLGPYGFAALAPLIAVKEAHALGEAGRKHLKRLRKTFFWA